LNNGESIPESVTVIDIWNCEATCEISFGIGFSSDDYHTPDNLISPVAIEGLVEGIKIANRNEAGIETIVVTATTNAHHGKAGPANWDTSPSNHYVKNGAQAIDIGMVNGSRPSGEIAKKIQEAMDQVPTIRENFGPAFDHKLGKTVSDKRHNTWIHVSFRER
jgi:hypothetical protein